jgi:CheY-like chemotaxis protein
MAAVRRKTHDMSAKRILVVDDEEPVRSMLKLVLTAAGFLVSEALDGEDAVRQVARRDSCFDAVLLDQNMPGMSGTEAFCLLREHILPSKIVLLSGMMGLAAEEAAAIGAHRFLPKPFLNAELIQVVNEAAND